MGALVSAVMDVLWEDGRWMIPAEVHAKLLPGLALGGAASLAITQLGHAAYCVQSMAGSCSLH